ncbi:MAG: hypothetical protein COA97_06015 [Flavobacteriales bacterium]|nr:MAG: hypothetical protein COA97_06015 [Flavobacteriales bacterium]
MNNSATIIVLAWPDTKVIQEGKWYDEPMRWVSAITDGYYKAGHSAFLLINNKSGSIEYFDFGRYHTPIKYGRVRSKLTDPDIEIKHRALINNGVITNLEEILLERFNNKSCHGEGRMTASIVKNIVYNKAYNKVMQIQSREAVPYGPFEFRGTTCSRLVAQVVLKSTKNWLTKFMIIFPYTISATPRSNNKVLNDCCHFYEVSNGEIIMRKSKFYGFKKFFKSKTKETIVIKVLTNNLTVEFI